MHNTMNMGSLSAAKSGCVDDKMTLTRFACLQRSVGSDSVKSTTQSLLSGGNMKLKSSVLIVAIAGLLSTSVLAQNARVFTPAPILTAPSASTRAAILQATQEPLTVSKGQGYSNGHVIAATDIPISSAPALREFRLWFNNGDHKMRRIGMMHEEGALRATFSDQNDDDSFTTLASWVNVPGATGGTITATGGGVFNVQLPPKPPNTTLVLSGFAFERLTGTDNNLRTVSIRLNQENSTAQVSLIDDQGSDFRNVFDQTMMGGLVGNLPFGAIAGGVMSTESMVRALINEGRTTPRAYAATIQYAFIPNNRIVANGAVSGTDRSKDSMQGQMPRSNLLAIRGFSFRFNNSDHHMLGVGVHIMGMPRFPGQRGPENSPITYQDQGTDDPIQWLVDYSTLQ
jgi:hypothetical protein